MAMELEYMSLDECTLFDHQFQKNWLQRTFEVQGAEEKRTQRKKEKERETGRGKGEVEGQPDKELLG